MNGIDFMDTSFSTSHIAGRGFRELTQVGTVTGSSGLATDRGMICSVSSGRYLRTPIPQTVTGGVGFYYRRLQQDISSNDYVCILENISASWHLALRITDEFSFYVTRGSSTNTAVDTRIIPHTTWIHVEMKWTIDNVAGSIEVRLNGSPINAFSFAGDTQNGGTAFVDAIRWVGGEEPNHFDDLVIWDTTGTKNNDWLGDVSIETLRPEAPGAFSDFTPLSGANWNNVNKQPIDGATYVTSTVAGNKDRHVFPNLPSYVDTVLAVQTGVWTRNRSAGLRTLGLVNFDGVTEAVSAPESVRAAERWHTWITEDHPSGPASWTPAEVDAGEFGYTVIA